MNTNSITHIFKKLIRAFFILSMLSYLLGFVVLFKSNYDFSTFINKLKSINLYNFKFYMEENKFNYNFCNSGIFKEFDVNDITSVYVNASSQNIQLNAYEGDKLQIKVTSPVFITNNNLSVIKSQPHRFDISLKDPTKNLNISMFVPKSLLEHGNFFIDTNDGDIFLHNFCADSINCSTYYGDIYISDTTINYLTLKTHSGNINIKNNYSNFDSKIELYSGDFFAIGSFGLLTLDNACGTVSLNTSSVPNDMSINCTSGNITLSFPKDSDYQIHYNTLSGSILTPDYYMNNGTEEHMINVTTTSGNLFVSHNAY